MNGDNIIKSLNKHIDIKRGGVNNKLGWVILQKDIIPNPSFKIYKTFVLTLWYVRNGKKFQILSFQEDLRTPDDKVDSNWDIMYAHLLVKLFYWIDSDSYNEVIEGTYNGIHTDE